MIKLCLANKHSRLSALMAIFVIVALCGIVTTNFSAHHGSKQLNCAVSKPQGNASHTTVAKYAPFLVVSQQTYEFNSPTPYSTIVRQEPRTALSLTRSNRPSRAPPAAPLDTVVL